MRIIMTCLQDTLVGQDYAERLKRCLDSLKKYSPEIPVDLLKVDTKKTKIAEELYNEYIKTAKDDIMVWHTDMIATEGWYEKVKEYWDCFDIIGCKLVYPNGLIQHFGGAIRQDGIGCHPEQFLLDIGFTKPQETAFVTGPSMIIKNYVYKKIKWDKEFTAYPDVDFCFQAREKGFKVGVIPVTLIHEEAKTRDTSNESERLRIGHEKFITKWMPTLAKYKNEITN